MTVSTKDETEIRELLSARAAAMRARDPERVVADYAPEVVTFNLAPPLRQASADVRDVSAWRQWFAQYDETFDFEIRDLEVIVGGDVAYCHSLQRMGTTPSAPEQFQLWFRATTCLRRRAGRWWITHEHESTPFYMDGSFRAAIDLQP